MIRLLLGNMRPDPDGWVLVLMQVGMLIFITVFVAVLVRLALIKDKGTTLRYSSLPLDDGDVAGDRETDTHGSASHG